MLKQVKEGTILLWHIQIKKMRSDSAQSLMQLPYVLAGKLTHAIAATAME
jgi:hypothetical protein